MMKQLVILSPLEQEYLLHAIEAALPLRDARQFFLWTQGSLQALLPHQVLVCLQFGPQDQLRHVECQHSAMLDAALRSRLSHPEQGLAPRLARYCRQSELALPAMLDLTPGAAPSALSFFSDALSGCHMENVLLHASERLPGGWTCFVLFGLPQRPRARHAYFLELLLPYLHLVLQRIQAPSAQPGGGPLARPLSARELEVLHWVREGKSNDEIGQILGLSGLTVKNHLQRLYRLLQVSNRTHAVARATALHLLDPPSTVARAA